jgi:membrane fusion protein, type I secretion system
MLKLDTESLDKPTVNSAPYIKEPLQFGLIILLVFVGGFLLWSLLAPLESAAVATGRVTVDTNRKSIQHLEGGIVEKLYVRDGDKVKKGDILIQLKNTQSKASLDLVRGQVNELLALEARLVAQRDKAKNVVFSEALLKQKDNPKVAKIMKSQKAIFKAEHDSFKGQIEILRQRVVQLEKEIDSLNAQVTSETKQLKLIEEEIEAVAFLEKKKLIEKPRLLALQREAARLIGNRGEHLGLIAKAQQKIGETKTQLIAITDKRQKDALQELRDTQQKLADLLEKEKSAEDVSDRTTIRAPQSGTVVSLQEHTIGGVLRPGETVMDIVPSGDKLVIEAQIDPLDIDVVHKGLEAKVNLTAFKQRSTPALDGVVDRVSADSFTNEQTGATYYLARVSISADQLKRLHDVKLYPGMPVQVMIITDKRTPFAYFVSPIQESFRRAFREQ